GPVGQQVDEHGRVNGDHPRFPAARRPVPWAPSPAAGASSAKRPRARDTASSTFLRRMIRPSSSSTLSTVPLVRPSASRTALGRVIWPRSATVASMDGSKRLGPPLYILFLAYFRPHTLSDQARFALPSPKLNGKPVHWRQRPKPIALQPQEVPHGRLFRHASHIRGQRQDLYLCQPAEARRALRHRPPALLDEDPAGESAPQRGRGERAAQAHRGGGELRPDRRYGYLERLHAGQGGAAALQRRALSGDP